MLEVLIKCRSPGAEIGNWIQRVIRVNSAGFRVMMRAARASGVKDGAIGAVNYHEELRESALAGLKAGRTIVY